MPAALDFVNAYFDLNPAIQMPPSSDLGFEVSNQRSFIPDVSGYQTLPAGAVLYEKGPVGTTVKRRRLLYYWQVRVSWSYLASEGSGAVIFTPPVPGAFVRLRSLQAFRICLFRRRRKLVCRRPCGGHSAYRPDRKRMISANKDEGCSSALRQRNEHVAQSCDFSMNESDRSEWCS
jgi:hypothetical protein